MSELTHHATNMFTRAKQPDIKAHDMTTIGICRCLYIFDLFAYFEHLVT